MLSLRLALRNFLRHRRRSVITSAAIALGLTMLITFTGLAIDGHNRMAEMGIRLGSGHVVVQGEGFQREQTLDFLVKDPERVESLARDIKGVARVAKRIQTSGLLASGELSAAVIVAGVDPEMEPKVSDLASPDHRTLGAYLRTRDELPYPSDPADIYIGDKLARTLDVGLEDRIVLTVAPVGASRPAAAAFRVRGVFHTGVDELDGFYVQIPVAEAQSMLSLGTSVTQVALLLDNLRDTRRVEREMRQALERQGAKGLEVLPWQVALRELYEAIVIDDIGNYLMHTIVFLIVAIGIFNTILMSVMERTREFGVMLAIGTSAQRLFAIVMAEAAILAVVASAAGLAIGLSLHSYIAHVGLDVGALYGEDFEIAGIAFGGRIYSTLYVSQVASWTAMVIAIVLFSSLYPAYRATRLKPVEAMHHA